MWIDPPEGWRYGFPKELPVPEPRNIIEWLVAEGYPQALVDQMGPRFSYWCRYYDSPPPPPPVDKYPA